MGLQDLSQARDKVTRLLRRTPPDGVEYTATVSRIAVAVPFSFVASHP